LKSANILQGRHPPEGNEIVKGADRLAAGELREPAAYSHVLAPTATGGREMLGLATEEDPVPAATAAQRTMDRKFMK
jgi:hypothetical protein